MTVDREQAIKAARRVWTLALGAPDHVDQSALAEIVDAILALPDPEAEGLIEALDWAKAPTTDEALAGVERAAGAPPTGYSLAGRVRALYSRERIEANRQRQRAEKAEAELARLRRVETAARDLFDASNETLGALRDIDAYERVVAALNALRAALSDSEDA